MTLTPYQEKMRDHYESLGIYARWTPGGGVELNQQQVGILAVWAHDQVRGMIVELREIFDAERTRITNLEDDVSDLKGFVYHGEESGV